MAADDAAQAETTEPERWSARLGTAALLLAATPALLILATSLSATSAGPAPASGRFQSLGVPALVAGVCLAALRLRPALRGRVGLLALSAVVSAYGAEMVVAGSIRPDAGGRVLHDGRLTKLDVVAALRQRGVRAFPAVCPFLFLDDHELDVDGAPTVPLGGISGVTTVFCNEGNRVVAYESDEHGFNNPHGLWPHGVDVVVVGDSFVQGNCVATEDTLAGRLRAEIGPTIGIGMGGDGPLMELAAIREYVPHLHPKVVVWVYFEGNDLSDLRRDRGDALLSRYVDDDRFSQHLVARQVDLDRALALYAERDGAIREAVARTDRWAGALRLRTLRAHVRELGARLAGRGAGASQEPGAAPDPEGAYARDYSERELELLGRVIAAGRRAARSAGAELLFVYLPEWGRYATPGGGDRSRSSVLDTVGQAGLPVLDLHPVFSQRRPATLFQFTGARAGHLDEEGYRVVARAIASELRARRLLGPGGA